jgi:hypothetical protein
MTGSPSRLRRAFAEPMPVGRLVFPAPGLLLLATLGAVLLTVVALNRWATPSDESAYWRAAQRLAAGGALYDLSLPVGTPYVYLYPPPLAQVLAPLALVLPDPVFMWAWTALLLGCLWFLGRRRVLVALALIAFVPVAVELWYRNVHLLLAVLVVLAMRRHPAFWVPAAAIKITPVLGLLYLVARRRYRDALIAAVIGVVVLAVSVALSPDAWRTFLGLVSLQGGSSGASIVPVPFPLRFGLAVVLVLAAARWPGRVGDALVVCALVVGNPTLWVTAFSLLAAIPFLWMTAPVGVTPSGPGAVAQPEPVARPAEG